MSYEETRTLLEENDWDALRGESRFSDHRPVCGVFAVEVDGGDAAGKMRSCYSLAARIKPASPQRHGGNPASCDTSS